MKVLLHPTYFPSIATFAVLAQREVVWEIHDNFQKQTYRNRAYICTDRGKHMLNIPISHVGGEEGRQKYSEVVPDKNYAWQKLHWRTLETAYRTSPFFEFYEDDLKPIFEEQQNSLLDFNRKTIQVVGDCLGLPISDETSLNYEKNPVQNLDARFLVNAKKDGNRNLTPYLQVFEERHGFVSNLSVLDLLFNEGTNALSYLKKQPLDFLYA